MFALAETGWIDWEVGFENAAFSHPSSFRVQLLHIL